MIRKLMLMVGLALALAGTAAQAQTCNVSVSNLTFGNVDVLSGSAVDTSASVSISCTGLLLTSVRLCLAINAGTGGADSSGRYMLNGANSLRYQLYQDSARTTIWGSTTWGFPGNPEQIDLALGLSGSASTTTTIYGRVFGAQSTAPAGSYSSSFSGSQLSFAYATLALFNCNNIVLLPPQFASASFAVSASVVSNCLVNAQNINFGSQGSLSANVDATGQVSATCTPQTNYSVSLSNGNTGTAPTARQMSMGAAAVTYGLYLDAARSQAWGSTIGTNTTAGTGTGSAQNYTVYGRVPSQATPAAGTYTDTIVVTLTY
jgi:spore coat protein U-like protein